MKFTNYIPVFTALLVFSACNNKTSVYEIPPPVTPLDTTTSKAVFWLTTPDEATLFQRQHAIGFSTATNSDPTIVIDTTEKFQSMDGFGYTLTSGSATLINDMSAGAKTNLLNELFGNNENSCYIVQCFR